MLQFVNMKARLRRSDAGRRVTGDGTWVIYRMIQEAFELIFNLLEVVDCCRNVRVRTLYFRLLEE